MKTNKLQRRIVANLNAIIHRENLYYLRPDGLKIRLIDARVENGAIVLTELNSGATVTLASCGGTLSNGYLSNVRIEDL